MESLGKKSQGEQELPSGSEAMNWTSNHADAGSIPGPIQWVKNLVLLWLSCRLAATAPIRPLAWELPYAASTALKNKTKKSQGKQCLIRSSLMAQ